MFGWPPPRVDVDTDTDVDVDVGVGVIIKQGIKIINNQIHHVWSFGIFSTTLKSPLLCPSCYECSSLMSSFYNFCIFLQL